MPQPSRRRSYASSIRESKVKEGRGRIAEPEVWAWRPHAWSRSWQRRIAGAFCIRRWSRPKWRSSAQTKSKGRSRYFSPPIAVLASESGQLTPDGWDAPCLRVSPPRCLLGNPRGSTYCMRMAAWGSGLPSKKCTVCFGRPLFNVQLWKNSCCAEGKVLCIYVIYLFSI